MAARILYGNNCGRKGAGVYGSCAAKVTLEQSGEVYPAEEGESYCSKSKIFVRFHFSYICF